MELAAPHLYPLIEEARDRQRRRRTRLALTAVAVAAVAVAAHGFAERLGDGRPVAYPAAAALPNPCTLLTDAEVAKVFGANVAYKSFERRRGCTWSGWPFPGRPGQQTVAIDVAPATRAQFERAYSTWVIVGEGPRRIAHSQRIDGFGEAAFARSYAQSFAGVDLETYYDGLVISVSTTFVGPELAAEKRLTTAAIARLMGREAAA